ncbi:hypothetical protein KY290_021877 [Solanum tuberosum]|uniref:adenylate kinase n=1 Tax=Solanum tuberosum TaxID=4113 RepID=A0ABQ7V2R9_SOLTU|nr:hypothetical protein KY289_021037 [Solanum tuberosum]KAH0693694.1 hypothetical protein KY285_020791 [Solanum tuberosum]KAH0758384.1 hypothetical protein KY290_021877 [Solanum tuberosum]
MFSGYSWVTLVSEKGLMQLDFLTVVRTWRCRPTNFSQAFSEKLPTPEAKGRNVQWVFLGYPGVRKGTYAARLSKLLGVPHIATGDLVRQQLSSHGPLASKEEMMMIIFFRFECGGEETSNNGEFIGVGE